MKISIIIPTFRRFEPLLNTINDLLKQEYEDFEVIIADQNDVWPDEFKNRIECVRRNSRVKWLKVSNPGVVSARHDAIQISTGDILFFVDDDVNIPEKSFLSRHVHNYSNNDIHAVAGRELKPGQPIDSLPSRPELDEPTIPITFWEDESIIKQAFHFGRNCDYRTKICSLSTCNASIRRSVFFSVGGFDEGFSGNSYGDDYDLAIRLVENGYNIVYDPLARLVHLKAPLGGLRTNKHRGIHFERQMSLAPMIFVFRYLSYGSWGVLIYEHLLRKTMLRKQNIIHPWRQLSVWGAMFLNLKKAIKIAKQGPVSRFL